MLKSHSIQLMPNKAALSYIARSAGTARFTYNWALNEWNNHYKLGLKPKENELRKQLNSIKREQFPWMYEASKCCPQQAIKDLDRAFKNFFAGRAKHPKFKKKHVNDSFYLSNDQFKIEGKYIFLPNFGRVKLAEHLRFNGKILGCRIRRKANRWYVSVQVEINEIEVPKPITINENQVVGIDLGIKDLAVLSDGRKFEGSKSLSKYQRQLRRLQKSLSRKKKGSNSYRKDKMKLAILYKRITDTRNDYLHKITTYVVKNYKLICIEDLNVKGMVKNHKLARSLSDQAFGETRRQLEYKSKWYGSEIFVADRFYPSSKTCSVCGHINRELALSDRQWVCSKCAMTHDRDINAALNLKNLGRKFCGDSAWRDRKTSLVAI